MDAIYLYTDGACSGNPGPGGLGTVAFVGDDIIMQNSVGYRLTTNNRMEILAVIHGLQGIKYGDYLLAHEVDKIIVCSDSQLVVNTMTQGWKAKTNVDLWKTLQEELHYWSQKDISIEFRKIKGHSDDARNIMADNLAVSASKLYGVAMRVDVGYEDSKLVESVGESSIENVVVTSIILRGQNNPDRREVEVYLSNGGCVRIIPCQGGFQQVKCTRVEAGLTVDIAFRFKDWLNGGDL